MRIFKAVVRAAAAVHHLVARRSGDPASARYLEACEKMLKASSMAEVNAIIDACLALGWSRRIGGTEVDV